MCLWSRNRNYKPFPPLLPLFQSARQSLLISIKEIDESILKKHDEPITNALLHFTCLVISLSIIFSAVEFIVSTERFNRGVAIWRGLWQEGHAMLQFLANFRQLSIF